MIHETEAGVIFCGRGLRKEAPYPPLRPSSKEEPDSRDEGASSEGAGGSSQEPREEVADPKTQVEWHDRLKNGEPGQPVTGVVKIRPGDVDRSIETLFS